MSVTNSRPPLDARARRNHRIAVWCGVLVAIGFPLGWGFLASFLLPPLSPLATPQEVANFVAEGGVMQKVGCAPDFDDPKGDMIRDRLDADRVSGRFNVTLIGCDDYFTGEPVDVPNLPYTLRGEVNLARK